MANPATSLVVRMAQKYGVDPNKLYETLAKVSFRIREKNAPDRAPTNEEMMSLLIVAETYGLNPFVREIFAFKTKGGTVVPVVSVDGWLSILNRQPDYDGLTVSFSEKTVKIGTRELPESCTVAISRKSLGKPIVVSEYMSECFGGTDIWSRWPHRMLRHKAIIQCIRVAFGVAGIYDEDEVSAMSDAPASVVVPVATPVSQPKAEPVQVVEAKEVPKLTLDTKKLDQISEQLTEMISRFPDNGHAKALQWAEKNLEGESKDYVLSKLPKAVAVAPAPAPQPAPAPVVPAAPKAPKPAPASQPAPRKDETVLAEPEPEEAYVPDVGDIPF